MKKWRSYYIMWKDVKLVLIRICVDQSGVIVEQALTIVVTVVQRDLVLVAVEEILVMVPLSLNKILPVHSIQLTLERDLTDSLV